MLIVEIKFNVKHNESFVSNKHANGIINENTSELLIKIYTLTKYRKLCSSAQNFLIHKTNFIHQTPIRQSQMNPELIFQLTAQHNIQENHQNFSNNPNCQTVENKGKTL